jgi:hypothetical protein
MFEDLAAFVARDVVSMAPSADWMRTRPRCERLYARVPRLSVELRRLVVGAPVDRRAPH